MSIDHDIPWGKKFLLRVAILFIGVVSIPLQADFYTILFTISWANLIPDLFNLLTFLPHYFGALSSLYDWLLLLAIAAVGALVWLRLENGSSLQREFWYFYYLRVFARFKLAAILFVAGFIKLFPLFAPDLSLSHLNTAYGQFEDWKHLLLSLSAAPAYLVFLGIVELLGASLLLFRRTAFLGVVFIIPFYGNAFLADLAYQGPTYFASAYVVLLTVPIFLYDVNRLASLVVHLRTTLPAVTYDAWSRVSWSSGRWVFKLLFAIIFIGFVGVRAYQIHQQPFASLHYPEEAGLPDIQGKYVVDRFVWNGDTIPYSPTDTLRWKDVVFEKWNTLSVRLENAHIVSDTSAGLFQRVADGRDYEFTHVGDRLYYRYTTAQGNSSIRLHNPNTYYKHQGYTLQVDRPDLTHVNLSGVSHQGDSLQVALRKTDKKYLLEEIKKQGRRSLGYKL
ncbi:hypothetical protein M8998_04990 [Sphingobacterium sp. lm-10]|uniref:hypothetical protein n=1 Tax=Sphingobacterium sp. lm-10 TaxID=2944904 RepID=UPI00202208F8|nr:hypothetical protein [Sphingobacterium sp. lm-10]MCL7987294.1 hypothetical protein [Sphingobacterium sp. lm-10]